MKSLASETFQFRFKSSTRRDFSRRRSSKAVPTSGILLFGTRHRGHGQEPKLRIVARSALLRGNHQKSCQLQKNLYAKSWGLGQAKLEPSWQWWLWHGLSFDKAKATSSQAKARTFRPSQAVHRPTSTSTSRASFHCPHHHPLWSEQTFWIQGRWVMNCLLALFVSLCGDLINNSSPPFWVSLWDKRQCTGFHKKKMSWADYQVAPASEFLLWVALLQPTIVVWQLLRMW